MNILLPPASVLSDVHSILESKIQYIEFQAHSNLQDCAPDKVTDSNSGLSTALSLTQNFERMLQQISKQTGELKLLQIIRCWLREENITKVMELLHEDTYRQHSEESLEKILKTGAFELMCLRYN